MFTFRTIAPWICTRSCPCSARALTCPQCSFGSAGARSGLPAWLGIGSIPSCMFIIGGLDFLGNRQSAYALGSLLSFLNIVYNATLGPICHTFVREVSSTRLREKSIFLARIAYQLMNMVRGSSSPACSCRPHGIRGSGYAGKPTLLSSFQGCRSYAREGLLRGTPEGLSTVYCLLRLPSTGGSFVHRVLARRFARTKADRACPCEVRGARAQLPGARRVCRAQP
jgi:SP family general alpha glucoside:H+ symporter-like MFS transporter